MTRHGGGEACAARQRVAASMMRVEQLARHRVGPEALGVAGADQDAARFARLVVHDAARPVLARHLRDQRAQLSRC